MGRWSGSVLWASSWEARRGELGLWRAEMWLLARFLEVGGITTGCVVEGERETEDDDDDDDEIEGLGEGGGEEGGKQAEPISRFGGKSRGSAMEAL